MFGFYFIFFIITDTFNDINIFVAANVRKSGIAYKQIESKDMELVTQKEILFELLKIKKLSQ
jgi:hypothetical protein